MTEKMIENRVKKLQAIEAQQKELEAAAEAIRAELKADMEERGVDELETKNFLLRWKERDRINFLVFSIFQWNIYIHIQNCAY